MPLDPDKKRQYQREYMARRRQTGKFHQHYWLRKAGDDFAVCVDWKGHKGCGEKQKYEGKLLATQTDGLPEWPELIQGMDQKEIDRLLDKVNTKLKKAEQ